MAIIIPPVAMQSAGTSPSATTSAGPALARFFAVLMFLAGVSMLIGMSAMQERAQRSQSWPTTVGRVVETRVEQQSGENKKKFRPIIRYAYDVAGATYESTRYTFGSTRLSKTAAEELCARYSAGSEVQVHYDPARPAEAVLVVQPARGAAPLGIIGALVMALGAFVFTLSFRSLPGPATIPSAASA